jgi:hypothetical protein
MQQNLQLGQKKQQGLGFVGFFTWGVGFVDFSLGFVGFVGFVAFWGPTIE